MFLLYILGGIASLVAGIFMHRLIQAMCEKYYLRWPSEGFTIVLLYILGVLPCLCLGVVGFFVALSS